MTDSFQHHSTNSTFDNNTADTEGINRDYGPGKFQKHHIITSSLTSESASLMLKELGDNSLYTHNDFDRNGVWLPTNSDSAQRLGITKHLGPHQAYNEFVSRILEEIATDLVNNKLDPNISDQQARQIAADKVNGFQAYLMDGLHASFKGAGDRIEPELQLNGDRNYGAPDQTALRAQLETITLAQVEASHASQNAESYFNNKNSIFSPLATGGNDAPNFLSHEQRALKKLVVLDSNPGLLAQMGGADEVLKRLNQFNAHELHEWIKTGALPDGFNGSAFKGGLPIAIIAGLIVGGVKLLGGTKTAQEQSTSNGGDGLDWSDLDELGTEIANIVSGITGRDVGQFATMMAMEFVNDGRAIFWGGPEGTLYVIQKNISGTLVDIAEVFLILADLFPYEPIYQIMKPLAEGIHFLASKWNKYVEDGRLGSTSIPKDIDTAFANGSIELNGDDESQFYIANDDAVINGGGGTDYLLHFGAGKIDGGAGEDYVVTLWADGVEARGGADDDWIGILGGQSNSAYGDAGDDTILAYGQNHKLYGGSGSDTFIAGPSSFIMDATEEDSIYFGGFGLTGGVQFGWQESPYAYWQPFSAILMGVPTVAAHFAEFWTLFAVDIAFMSWMRYYQTDSGQLVAEMARGLGGKIVIENYDLNIETGRATGGVTVFSVDYTEFNSASVSDFNKFVDLALQQGFGFRLGGYDPLVIDLDKDGLDLTRRNQRDVYFDLDADGFAESTGWVREDDGLLAVDLNSDGEINDISELFGDETTAGLTALAAYDSNQDGVINSQDALFSDLLIWQDLNQNGKTDAGELSDLATHGIVEISLTGRAPDQAVVGGNDIREVADVTFADGTTSIAGDVWFSADQTDSLYLGDTTTSAAADALPSIRGFGDMTSLRVAMTNDAALLTLVTNFTTLPATTDWLGYQSAATSVLFQWAGVSAVAATPLGSGGFDLQKLAFLEKAAGLQLAPRDETTGDVLDTNVTELELLWQEALSSNTARLLFQSGYQGYLSGLSYDETTDVFKAASDDPTALSDTFTNLFAALPADPVLAEQMWDQNLAPAIAAAIGIMTRHDGIAVRTDFVIGQLVRSHDGAVHNLTVDQLVDGLGYDNVQVSGPFLRGEAEGLQVYAGTTGDDTFTGGNGQDVYVFDDVIGHDVIFDAEPGSTAGGDRLRLVHLEETDVSFTRVGVDLVVTVIATGETITVKNQYTTPSYAQSGRQTSSNWGIEDVQFADGTIFELSDIGAAVGQGTELGETITGTGFDDQLTGGGGNDILEGGDGGDLYVFGAGDGEDIIRDEMVNPFNDRQDLLVFTGGISLDDLRFERTLDSDDLKITFDNPLALTDSITIIGQFAYSFYGYDSEYSLDQRVDAFATDRDLPINWIDLQQRVIESYTTDGDDITYGFGTTDVFEASAGNDWISGGDGGDMYQFGYESDHDTIEDNQVYQDIGFNILPGGGNYGTDDYLWFGPGISVEDVTFSAIAGTRDLLISIDDDPNVAGASDTLRIVDQFNGKRVDLFNLVGISWFDRVENFTFEDGTTLTWEDVLDIVTTGDDEDNDLIGDHRADTLTGNGGDDHLSGGDDGDTYVYNLGDGNDVIEDNQYDFFTSAADKLQFGAGITSSDVSFDYGPTEKDVVITLTDGSTITLVNQLNGLNNYIFGVNWFDRIETLEFTDAQGQVVDTIGWDAIMTSLVSRQQTAGDDTIYGIDSHFGAWSDTIDAGAGNDTIFARGGHDTITGGTGNDTIDGGWGNDTYIFNPGDGIDTVQDTGSGIDSSDTLVIGYNIADVSVARIAGTNDIVLTFAGSSDQITVINALYGKSFKEIDVYQFLDGIWTPTSIAQSLVDTQITEGADVILGSGTLNGLGGNDLIWGEGADDTLSGGAGDDFLDGGAGDDIYLYSAGDGHDTIHDQGNGLDTDDILKITGYTSAQTSVVLFNGLNQIDLVFAGSNDRISIIDPLTSGAFTRGINHIEFVDEGVTWGQAEISALAIAAQATAGDDVILGSDIGDIIDGSTGHDDISGGKGKDDITGGAGNDRIDGGTDDDTYRFGQGDGQDTITDTGNGLDNADRLIISDYLSSETIVQRITGTENVLLTFAGSTDSITLIRPLTGTYLNQIETYEFEADGTIWTPADMAARILVQEITAGDDDMQGFDTDDTIFAGPGNDAIHGYGGDDILSGDVGDDFIDGGSGDDTYLYTIGDGHDTIHDQGNGLDTDDILKITGYSTAQTTVEIVNGTNQIDLVFTLDGDRISLINPLESSAFARGINLIEFVDEGITWGSADISALVMAAQSTSGDDQIIGSGIADIITGGLGDDHIEGGKGNDTYIFSLGDGNDTINDNGDGLSSSDQLIIHGYATGDVSAAWVGSTDNIELSFAGTSDTIILVDGLNQLVTNTIEEFVFDDATVWHKTVSGDAGFVSELSTLVTASQVSAGDDVIRGSQLRDDIDGGAGNDTIDGDDGNDTLAGGLGDDYVDGGWGDDTYIFNLGDGHDTIFDNGSGLDGDDRLIINGYLIGDVTVTQVAGTDNVEITFAGSTDKITLIDPLAGGVSKTIEYYEFVDGGTTTVWTKQDLIDAVAANAPPVDPAVTHLGTAGVDTLNGTSGNDGINGLTGDDTLNGNAGNDTYLYASGDGNDTISDSVYAAGDVLKLTDLNATDIQLSKSGNHMLITDLVTGHVITDNYHFLSATSLNRGIDTIEFADGSSWDYATINANAWIRGTSGNDSLSGSSSFDETLRGYAGDDTLAGSGGADTYVYASGDGNDTISDSVYVAGDVLKLTDLNATDIQLSKSGNHMLITDLITGHVITDNYHFLSATNLNRGIDTIEFADGSSWDYATINANAWIRGTSGNDSLSGSSSFDEILQGYAGDDTLAGAGGADTYVYASGDGNDTINDSVYVAGDVLKLTDLNAADIELSKSGFHLLITDTTTSEVITDNYHFLSSTNLNRGIDTIEFADGSSWDYETINAVARIGTTMQADTVSGTTGDDLIVGLAGNDTLTGLAGADTFVFAAGDGSDTVTDFSIADADLIDVSAYGFASNTGFTSFSFDGTDTLIDFNGTDQLTVAGIDLTTQPNPDDAFIFV